MPTTYVVEDMTMTPLIVSPVDGSLPTGITVQVRDEVDVTRTVVFYPAPGPIGGTGETAVVF